VTASIATLDESAQDETVKTLQLMLPQRRPSIMGPEDSYRVVAVAPDGARVVLDESLELTRAEQLRALLLQMNAYPEIVVEHDVVDDTPKATIDGDQNAETVAFP
jgi:hypothetical protein